MIFSRLRPNVQNSAENAQLTLDDPRGWSLGLPFSGTSKNAAMKLSAVNACVETISNSISKLPIFLFDEKTKEHVRDPLLDVLEMRPNEAMTPSVHKKLIEANRLLHGNGYDWIVRGKSFADVQELIPLPPEFTRPWLDDRGVLWYIFTDPKSGKITKLASGDVLHYKAYSRDGITGVSVLERASEVISTARSAQGYEHSYYAKGAHVGGVLTTDSDLRDHSRDKIREEWANIHAGADNAFRVAVLDLGLKYQPIGATNKDSQFIESKAVSVEDISRFFGVPLYKLNAGKQSYSSNEQNGIEYVTNTLHPAVTQYEQEDTYKLLFKSSVQRGLRLRRNMMAELRGDVKSRGEWYKSMREVGAFSANDILALEDMPSVPGGASRYASLNYVPLDLFEQLSIARNGGEKNEK